MFRKLGHTLLIIALLSATGTHWFVLQSVAWTTMLANNLQTTSFCQAMERTFDGRHPCKFCKRISQGKQTEKKSDLQVELKKLEFSYAPAVFIFTAPTIFWETASVNNILSLLTSAPPVPPPRELLG
ncbi:MAG: hypothetical protein QOD03_1411 [Verrucomicrobiota bacterium]